MPEKPHQPGADAAPVFISYRRDESTTTAANLRNCIDAVFGEGSTFLDESGIEVGEDFEERVLGALDAAEVVVWVIGPNWLGADPWGRHDRPRRIDDPEDFCRRELQRALDQRKAILPVLDRAPRMPPVDALPQCLQALPRVQAATLEPNLWGKAVRSVLEAIRRRVRPTARSLPPLPTVAGAAAIAVLRQHQTFAHARLVSFLRAPDAKLGHVHIDLDLQRDAASTSKHRGPPSLTLEDLLNLKPEEHDDVTGRWLITGHAGAGKSTIARHLAWSCGGLEAQEASAPIVLYVPLAVYAGADEDVFDHTETELAKDQGKRAAQGLAAELRRLAGPDGEPGRVWLLLDGLDEVAPTLREQLCDERLPGLAARLPCARIAVLGRPVGDHTLDEGFRRATLQALSPAQRADLIGRWLPKPRANALIEQLRDRPLLESLTQNPLLLTLIVQLFQEHGARATDDDPPLPNNRFDLYHRAIQLLLTKAHGRNQLAIAEPSSARRVLAGLSLALQEEEGIAWPRPVLQEALDRARRADEDVDWRLRDRPFQGNDDFLGQIGERTGILGPLDGPSAHWRYFHRQFREFLAAEALARCPQGWADRVGPLTDDTIPRWSETLGFYVRHSPADAGAVLKALRDASPVAAVRALEHVVGAEARLLIDLLWSEPLLRSAAWDGDDLQRLCKLWVDEGVMPVAELREQLWARLGPDEPIERVGWLLLALRGIGRVDEDAFFAAIGRPRSTQVAPDWVRLEGGTFEMGSPTDEPERLESEGPQHEVRVAGFALQRGAVTNAEYARFDGAHEAEAFGGRVADPSRHPVVNVGWWEAYVYSAWVGGRLPSEAEWEYACRAGTTGPFSFDGELTTELVNYDGDVPYAGGPKGEDRGCTVAVGSLPANPWGLVEMHGNVWEWCQDRWHDDDRRAPGSGAAWELGGSADRVLRGGSWINDGRYCRSACRDGGAAGYRGSGVGFRPARSD
ncbi:MAG: SUMF1/EgtB/PvdO family nonheme iron enzyme [Planctomycetota bacterium]